MVFRYRITAAILALCLAGVAFAQGTDASSAATAAEAPAAGADAGSAASEAGGPAAAEPFIGFKSTVAFHEAAGWGSAGLLLAAGVVGAVRAYDLIVPAHEYRDALGMDDEDQVGALCVARIKALWSSGQGLRWTHVGLLAAGETLYLSDAVTGLSWLDFRRPASTRAKLHRTAFLVHASLMAAEVVLGFVTTDALSRGDHELVSSLGAAHAAIGVAIPLTIGVAGLIEILPPPRTALTAP